MTPEDMKRIEKKLDSIIDFFNIGKSPRQIEAETLLLDQKVKAVIAKFDQKRAKKRKPQS